MKRFEHFPISKLKSIENNPRKITSKEFDKLKISISRDPEFLECRPVLVSLVDDIYYIYAGTQRVRAAKALKMKSVPCIIEQDLDDEVMKRRMLLDNRHNGVFDYDLLANEWELDFLLDCGFTPSEFNLSLNGDISESSSQKEKGNSTKQTHCPECGAVLNRR